MSAIYEEIVLGWKGEKFTVQPSYRMVQVIEARGLSILGVCRRLARGEPPMSHVAEIISHMLKSGGAKGATPENVYEHLMSHADAEEWEWIAAALTTAFIPQEKDPGKSGGPGDGADENGKTTETPLPT